MFGRAVYLERMFDIQKTYTIPFPVEAVYAAWTSSETVIPPAKVMEVDAVVGGKMIIVSEMGDMQWRMEGVFEFVEPEKRLVYSWEWNGDGEVSKVEVEFISDGEGTRVEVKHSGLPGEQSLAAHRQGWDRYIEGLSGHLADQA